MQFPFHRTTRPIKKVAVEQTESGSSDEENDDEDGFEILTAEKLFSTLLQRVNFEWSMESIGCDCKTRNSVLRLLRRYGR